MRDGLTDADYELVPSDSSIRWRTMAMFARLKMINQGLLRKGVGYGEWEITTAGRENLAREWQHWQRCWKTREGYFPHKGKYGKALQRTGSSGTSDHGRTVRPRPLVRLITDVHPTPPFSPNPIQLKASDFNSATSRVVEVQMPDFWTSEKVQIGWSSAAGLALEVNAMTLKTSVELHEILSADQEGSVAALPREVYMWDTERGSLRPQLIARLLVRMRCTKCVEPWFAEELDQMLSHAAFHHELYLKRVEDFEEAKG